LSWRAGKLVAQLYRQSNQEILLAYNDMANEMIVDNQQGYARAYFDNYRKQIIFTPQVGLAYMIDGSIISTETEDVGGYVSSVLVNEAYQIGVEIMDYEPVPDQDEQFNGLRSRVIDLKSKVSVTVAGLLFNRCLLVDDYFYGFAVSSSDEQLLDIINVKTMEHKRINTTKYPISFMYQTGNEVYAQSATTRKTFLLQGHELIEQDENFNATLPISDNEWQILKDIRPHDVNEHWYIEPGKLDLSINQLRFFRTYPDGAISEVLLRFKRDDIIQLMDVANYGKDHIATFLTTKDDNGVLHAIITVFDLQGNIIYEDEITKIRDGIGRFTYLDYVE